MLDPGAQLRQMVTSVLQTLRPNDPGEWKSLIHFLRSVSQSRYDFCPRAAELVSQLRNQRRMVCGRHLRIDLLSLFQGPLPRRPRAGPEFPYLHVVDRKSTRLNSSHANISYAVFCLKKKKAVLDTVSPPLWL